MKHRAISFGAISRAPAMLALLLLSVSWVRADGEDGAVHSKAYDEAVRQLAEEAGMQVDLKGIRNGDAMKGAELRDILLKSSDVPAGARLILRNIVVGDDVDLSNVEIPYDLRMENCRFLGRVELSGARVENGLSVQRSTFEQTLNLMEARVRLDLVLDDVDCRGKLTMTAAGVAGAISCNRAKFGGAVNMKQLTCAGFTGDGATIAGVVNADGMEVSGTLWLVDAAFEQYVSFGYMRVRDEFDLSGARFVRQANFCGMHVSGICRIAGATFAGPTNFILACIDGNLEAQHATFTDRTDPDKLNADTAGGLHHNADFGCMTVAGFAVFKKVAFLGTVSLRNATVGNLHLENATFGGGAASVRLDGLTYRHIRAIEARVPADDDGEFWVDQRKSWDAMRPLLRDTVEFNALVFEDPEAYFRMVGYPALADDVYLERNGLERERILHGGDLLLSWVLRLLVGYGRHPVYALYWSMGIVALGCFLFRGKNMQERRREERKPRATEVTAAAVVEPKPGDAKHADGSGEKTPPYSAFWYSLDLFVPLIDLKCNECWKPRPIWRLSC